MPHKDTLLDRPSYAPTSPEAPPPPSRRRVSRQRLATVALALVALVAVGGWAITKLGTSSDLALDASDAQDASSSSGADGTTDSLISSSSRTVAVALALEPATVEIGQPTTATVRVTAQHRSVDGTAHITVSDASGTVGSVDAQVRRGQASVRLPALDTAGTYAVRAEFAGTTRFQPGDSSPVELTVVDTGSLAAGAPATPTGDPTGIASPTSPSTATPTDVSTPSEAPASSDGSSSCPAPAFPDASCTGVPAGTALTRYAGPSTISVPGTVVDGKVLGCVRVTAPGVVIRRSKISCANPATDVVGSFDGDYSGTPLLLEDVEIDCQDGPGTAVGEARVTVRRADIHGCENGFDINQSVTVEDSYIHDLWNSAESHSDGMQLAGHLSNGAFVKGALNVTIRHNTIFGVGADGSLGTSAIIANRSGDRNVLIEQNLLAGGAYSLYCDGDTATNFRVVHNHFSKRFSSRFGAYGPSDGCADETLAGNVVHETGAPIHLD